MSARTRAVLVALAFVGSIASSGPVIAAPVPLVHEGSGAPASTTSAFPPTTIDTLAEGVGPRHGRWTTDDGPQLVELIDVDPAGPGISLEASGPGAGPNALETLRRQVARVSRDGTGSSPRSTVTSSGRTAPGHGLPAASRCTGASFITGSRSKKPTLGFDGAEQPRLADVALRAAVTLPDGTTTLAIDGVNKPRRSGDVVALHATLGYVDPHRRGRHGGRAHGSCSAASRSGTWTASVPSVVKTGKNTAIPGVRSSSPRTAPTRPSWPASRRARP